MTFLKRSARCHSAIQLCLALTLVAQLNAASPWRFWTKNDGLPESVVFGLTAGSEGRIIAKGGDVSSLAILDGYQVTTLSSPRAYGRFLSSTNGEIWTFDTRAIEIYNGSSWQSYANPEIEHFARNSAMMRSSWFTYSVFHTGDDRMDMIPYGPERSLILFPDRLVAWNRQTLGSSVLIRSSAGGIGSFRDIQSTDDGGVWISGDTGVARLMWRGSSFEWAKAAGHPGDSAFIYPSQGNDGELLVSVSRAGGIRAVLRLANRRWEDVYTTRLPTARLKGWRGPNGHIWIQEDRKIRELDAPFHIAQPNSGSAIAGLTTAVLTEPDASFWLGTTAGIARYAPPIWQTPVEAQWADGSVSAISEDPAHRLWFVADGYLVSEDHGKWQRYAMPMGNGEPLLVDAIVPLANGDLVTLANALHNLAVFRPTTGKFTVVPNPEGRQIGFVAKRAAGGVWVQSLLKDGSGWSLDVFDGAKFQAGGLPAFSGFKDLKAVLDTSDGVVWLASTNAVGRVEHGQLRTFTAHDGFEDTGVFSLAQTTDGHILLGGRDAISEYDGKSFRKLHDIDLAESICVDRNGTIWAGTGSGLHRYAPGRWITNDVEEGLPATIVRKVFADSQGRIWAGTGRGISVYHPTADTDPPITRIGDNRNSRETPPGGKVRLTFSGIDKWKFTPADRLLYSWRVDDAPWSEFRSADFASFEQLRAGRHRFEVRAMDRNGNISPTPAGYEFAVLLPWYKEVHFLLLATFLLLIICLLVRRLWRHHARLKFQSSHDPLTGLANRNVFESEFHDAINDARDHDAMVAIFLLDLDRFKPINDTLGHRIGDLFLQEVSNRLRTSIRKQDTVARLGGDEFAIVMPQLHDRSEAELMAERLLQVLREPYRIESFELFGSASIGVSLFPEHGEDPANLHRLADIAMYQCKARSKDEYVVFDSGAERVDFHSAQMASLIREALENHYFHLHYQPIEDARGNLTGFEALIRLDHPRLGALPPDDFIGIAERTGLIVRVGQWVLRDACLQTAEWHRSGRPDLRISVNVSSAQLMKSDFAAMVKSILEESGLSPGALTLEITETQMMQNPIDSASQLAQLQALGVRVALDDFGIGYSTLGSLHALQVDYIKIDRCFVDRLNGDHKHGLLVIEAVTLLAHNFGCKIVAEGVETVAQLSELRRIGCDLFQGFLLGRPVSAAKATELMAGEASFVKTLRNIESAVDRSVVEGNAAAIRKAAASGN